MFTDFIEKDLASAVPKRESSEISDLLTDSTLQRPSSVELGWKNFSIERRIAWPSEKPELKTGHHFLILWDVHVANGEMAYRGGQFSPYRKYPNTITTCPPGLRPAARNRLKHEVVVGAFAPGFLRGIEEEFDKRPNEAARGLHGTDDPELRSLLLLLAKESETGGLSGTLYSDSLAVALATRLIYAERLAKPSTTPKVSPLPARTLRSVVDRMQTDLAANLDLDTLAAESGFSRAHFLRAFRAATGQTPHRYLFEQRLVKARELIVETSMSLIDIAAACGFSSHSHLTTAFRSKFGLPPSKYRHGL